MKNFTTQKNLLSIPLRTSLSVTMGLFASLLLTNTAQAEQNNNTIVNDDNSNSQAITSDLQTTDPLNDLSSQEENTNNHLGEVTSIEQFSDVKPNDWAYDSLKSLIERYNCVTDNGGGRYNGNRSLTRYEFANDLNNCLTTITNLLSSANKDFVRKDELTSLQRLQTDFGPELAQINSRLDTAETKVTKLENSRFSPTTKLSAFAWFNVNGAVTNGNIKRQTAQREGGSGSPLYTNAINPEVTSTGYVWFDLTTSFTGKDSLVLELATGTASNPLSNQFSNRGVEYTFSDFTNQSGNYESGPVVIRELYYQFPVGKDLEVVVGPRFNYFRFFEYNRYAYYFSPKGGAPIFNYLTFNSANSTLVNAIDRGAGAIVKWNMADNLSLQVGYMGESNEYLPNPPFGSAFDPTKGVFGGTNTTTAELTYKASDRANIRFLYTRSNLQAYQQYMDTGVFDGPKVIGNGLAEPIYGVADDGFGGDVGNATANTFALNFDWALSDYFGVFGRYAYGSTNIYPKTANPAGQVNAQAFQLGLAFPDLFKRGTLGTLSFVVPFDIISGRKYLVSGGGNGGTELNLEASYYLPITDNIAIMPSLLTIFNANNFSDNPTIFIGNLRTQFTF
jgi:Carbohydrate-selective porin, OprB family/S-layer homology domain